MQTVRYALLGLPAILVVAGCSQQTIQSADKDTQHNIQVLNHTVNQVAKDAKPQIKKLDLGARVTAAITANQNLAGTNIRVDASTNGVRLRGTVKTPAQKALAGRVAQDTIGPGKTVTNALSIKGT
jgi:osmotically-inducible protein OsmY